MPSCFCKSTFIIHLTLYSVYVCAVCMHDVCVYWVIKICHVLYCCCWLVQLSTPSLVVSHVCQQTCGLAVVSRAQCQTLIYDCDWATEHIDVRRTLCHLRCSTCVFCLAWYNAEYFLCALKLAWYVNCRCIDTYRYRVSQKSKPDYYCNNFVYCQPTLIGWQLTKELKCQAKSCWPLKISGQFIFIMHFELCAC